MRSDSFITMIVLIAIIALAAININATNYRLQVNTCAKSGGAYQEVVHDLRNNYKHWECVKNHE